MEDLLKKLDEIMTSDIVRKIGGLFCLVTIVITAAAFFIGAGSMLKTTEGPSTDVEATDEEAAAEGEEATEEAEEETDEVVEEAEE